MVYLLSVVKFELVAVHWTLFKLQPIRRGCVFGVTRKTMASFFIIVSLCYHRMSYLAKSQAIAPKHGLSTEVRYALSCEELVERGVFFLLLFACEWALNVAVNSKQLASASN